MPSLTRLIRLGKLASLPETRHVLVSSVRSGQIQGAAFRAVHDRDGLWRDVRNQATSIETLRSTALHPATRELAEAGLLFLPVRYMPLGWAATWAGRRILRRRGETRPGRPMKNVTPRNSTSDRVE